MKATLSNLKWRNLKDNKCPKDGFPLSFSKAPGVLLTLGTHICTNSECDFKISEERFDQVVSNLYNRKKPYEIQTDGVLEESVFDSPGRGEDEGLFN